ncbi:MAG: hypothetical protein ACI8QF_003501 [Limisphaerales bacterium]
MTLAKGRGRAYGEKKKDAVERFLTAREGRAALGVSFRDTLFSLRPTTGMHNASERIHLNPQISP